MRTIYLNKWKNICLTAGLVLAAGCTPEENLPGVKQMDIAVSQSYVEQGVKAQWEVGDSVSVFFDGVKTPKYFVITSVSADKESATMRGDYPYGVTDGTRITAVYPHTAISADVSAIPVDLTHLKYKEGAIDMSSMIYSASALYEKDHISTLGFKANTAKVTLEIDPFDGFDPSLLSRVDISSSTLTTSASLNLLAGEDEDEWRLRASNGVAVTLQEPIAAKARTETGGVKIDLICIPTQEGQKVDKLNVYLTAGDDMFYAEVTDGFEIKQNSNVLPSKTSMLNKTESGALIFWRKLEEKQMNTGVIRDADGVFRAYYDINYDEKKVKFIELSKEKYEQYAPVEVSEQSLSAGYYALDWETPVCGVKGMSYDLSSDVISLKTEDGVIASIDGNTTAAEEFLAGNKAHYEIKFDRAVASPVFTRGAMSKTLWDGAIAQGTMTDIQLNVDRGWAFVTFPKEWTSYQTKYETLSKDRIAITWTGGLDFGEVDKVVNEQKLGDNILKNYFSDKNLFVPAVEGSHVFFVINTETGEWFKFQPQNEDDYSTIEGSAIEKRLLVSRFDAGVLRQNGEFVAYYDMDLKAGTVNFYSLNSGKTDIDFKEGIALTKEERKITWAEPLQGVTGIELDDANNLKLLGATTLTLDNNPTAASEFLDTSTGGHYAIAIDRSTQKCTKGNLPADFISQIMNHRMNTIELNQGSAWAFVTFTNDGSNNYTFYKTTSRILTKDEISFTNKDLSEFVGGYTVDKDLTPKIKGMLESFYDTNIVVRQKVGGLKPFYVINKAGKGWFLFDRQ